MHRGALVLPGGVGRETLAGRQAHGQEQVPVLHERPQMARQGPGVSGTDQKAIHPGSDYFTGPSGGGGQGRQAEGHALQVNNAETLVGGGHRQHLAAG